MLETFENMTKFAEQEMTETKKRNRQKTDSIWICLQNIFYKKADTRLSVAIWILVKALKGDGLERKGLLYESSMVFCIT